MSALVTVILTLSNDVIYKRFHSLQTKNKVISKVKYFVQKASQKPKRNSDHEMSQK
jgi:hypothetical protein